MDLFKCAETVKFLIDIQNYSVRKKSKSSYPQFNQVFDRVDLEGTLKTC